MKILILGGGFGGMFAAREVKKLFGAKAEVELVNEENYFVFQPLLPEVAGGTITPMHAVSPLRSLLKGIKVRQARVVEVDPEARQVTVFQGVQRRPTHLSYDHLIVAMGTTVNLSKTPGLAEHGLPMKTLDDARRLRSHILEKLEHADITGLPEVKREALTFCVIGAGFSGIETVGEMAEMIDRSLRHYPNIRPEEARIVVIEFADRILQEMPPKLADYAREILEKRGIEVQLGTGVASATGTTLETTKGEVIGTRTIVATIGNAPSPVVSQMEITKEAGKIVTDRTMRAVNQPDVWALGDCALIPMTEEASERTDFAPPTAQFAVREAKAVAANVHRAATGGTPQPFDYTSQGSLASLGARRGVAQVWGVTIRGWFAWVLWRLYYLSFIPGVRVKATVLFNWIIDGFSRSTVWIRTYDPPAVRYVHYRAGDRVFEAGNRADGVYTVLQGRVEIEIEEDGKTVQRTVGPGDHFGARVILGHTQRSGTVRAAEDSVVMLIERDAFERLVEGFPALGQHFEEHLMQTYGIEWRPKARDAA